MSNNPDLTGINWLYTEDPYHSRFESFERDVHILVLGTPHAAITTLEAECQQEEDKLEPHKTSNDPKIQERLHDEIERIWMYFGDQERFIRNMALVGLLSLLIHTLREMARSADVIAAGKKGSYRKQGDTEFVEIRREYQKRFGIDLIDAEKARVEFLPPLYAARNKIVHQGGEVNQFKHIDDVDMDVGDEGMLDLSFSKQYPQFVDGTGYGANISITDEQLDSAVDSSLALVRYLSEELYKKQLEAGIKERDASATTT
jgi:hypothetical protein